jgi:flagellar protein FlbD
MITLTKLNGVTFTLNADKIEVVEETPDTVVTLENGHKFIVKESRQEVTNLVKLYRQSLYGDIVRQIRES